MAPLLTIAERTWAVTLLALRWLWVKQSRHLTNRRKTNARKQRIPYIATIVESKRDFSLDHTCEMKLVSKATTSGRVELRDTIWEPRVKV